MRMRHKALCLILLFALALVCAFYALTPLIHRAHMNEAVAENTDKFYEMTTEVFKESAQSNELPYMDLLLDMQNYNAMLCATAQEGLSSKESYEVPAFSLMEYGLDDETFGVINIPKLNVELPIFLGANEANMAKGAAILSHTSIPLGSADTNSVIAGHRGWYGYKFFSDIELLELDDEVRITNLWQTMYYKVVDIQIVSPDDVDAIHIKPGRELITLLTCHPPNTGGRYRYLVFCERI